MSETDQIDTDERSGRDWRVRLAFITFVAIAVAVVWVTNQLLTERFTETTRNRAEVRLALYTGNLQSELQRNSVVPLLLSRDPALIGALNSGDFTRRRSG
jgi:two-component system, NtrC family, C4-dicarboxylate transport sensor histidine kinase DctB